MIAALFVQKGGVYWNQPGIDAWDVERDARKYAGPWPVVAHPPCSRWCQLAHVNQKRYGHRVGDDNGCFDAALKAVKRWGGVLEHPAESHAWPAFGLGRPPPLGWQYDLAHDAWVCEVAQRAYGHLAQKRTWLFYVGSAPPPMDWSNPAPLATVSFLVNHGDSGLPRLSKKAAAATPIAFRDALIGLARRAFIREAA